MKREPSTEPRYSRVAREHAERELSRELLEHALGSAEMAQALARRFGVDPDKAAAAAYLHDLAKVFPRERQAALARELGMSEEEIRSYPPPVLHGPLSALMVTKELGIDDAEVLQAIAAHSSGCAGMSDVAKVVFVADYIEHTREFPGAAELRVREYSTLDEATLTVLRQKLRYLIEERKVIDPRALQCWNELIGKMRT